jgi:ribosomal protein S12 methylthiotransferase accessory factor YcaO
MRKKPVAVSPENLAFFLRQSEPVVYSQNGNRSQTAARTWSFVSGNLRQIGVTRVADLSYLSPVSFPVMQTARPKLLGHTRLGQNSGSQGKGFDKRQALISSAMETIESYCLEPREKELIRNSYRFLRNAQFRPSFEVSTEQ